MPQLRVLGRFVSFLDLNVEPSHVCNNTVCFTLFQELMNAEMNDQSGFSLAI